MITVVVSAALVGVLAMSGGLSAAFREQWLFFLPVLALGASDGWLLFSPDRVRWVAWAVLPVANESIYQEFIQGPSAVSATGEPVRVSELLGIATAYILLRSVRRRAWLWPVIRVGTLFLIQFAYGTLESISGGDQAENFASWLNKFFQIPSGLALSGSHLTTSAAWGMWALTGALDAWALAWWMSPVERDSCSSAVSKTGAESPCQIEPSDD
jgi:hypothetical protein